MAAFRRPTARADGYHPGVNDLRSARFAIAAVGAAAAISACGSGSTPAPTPPAATPSSAPAPPVGTVAAAEPAPDVAPATVENALIEASGCAIDEQRGRDTGGIAFAFGGFGPSGSSPPHAAVDGSFTCAVAPNGTLSLAAARYADAAQAGASATWLQGGGSCHPLGTVGPWTILAARAVGKPQNSVELESAVSDLGGRMVATCRN